jgi:hypothetical protein
MELKCVINRDLGTVSSEISAFERPENDLVIRQLDSHADEVLFGCYIPTVPRPTSILSGRILVKRLGENQTELQATEVQSWAETGIMALIDHLSGGKN